MTIKIKYKNESKIESLNLNVLIMKRGENVILYIIFENIPFFQRFLLHYSPLFRVAYLRRRFTMIKITAKIDKRANSETLSMLAPGLHRKNVITWEVKNKVIAST